MQSKRLIYFIIACVIYIWAFSLIQRTFWPTKPPEETPPELTAEEKERLPFSLLGSYGGELAFLEQKKQPNQNDLSFLEKRDMALALLGSGSAPMGVNTLPPESGSTEDEKLSTTRQQRRITASVLGVAGSSSQFFSNERILIGPPDSDLADLDKLKESPYHFQVKLDPRGAAVRRLILTKFQAATDMGKPGEGPLVLIPETLYGDPARASFVLYHYNEKRNDISPMQTLEHTIWDVIENKEDDKGQTVVFQTEILGVRITKTFQLLKGQYHLGLTVKMERVAKAPNKDPKFRYQLAGAHGLPIEGRWYTDTFRQAMIGYIEEDDFARNYQDSRILRKEAGNAMEQKSGRIPRYAAVSVQYFASAIAVDNEQVEGQDRNFVTSARPTLESRVVRVKLQNDLHPGERAIRISTDDPKNPEVTLYLDYVSVASTLPKGTDLGLLCEWDSNDRLVVRKILTPQQTQPLFYDDLTVRLNSEVELKVGESKVHKYLLYNGPVKVRLLNNQDNVDPLLVDRYMYSLNLNTMTDYHSPGALGSFANSIFLTDLIIFFTNLMHTVLDWLYAVIPIYGICIILLTVLVRGMMFPLSRKQVMTSMKMQELAPELKALGEKYKDDPQKKMQEMMKLYRKHGVNPMGSCWVLLLQLPIFMGLYWAFRESVDFRLAQFLWIDNLSAPDMLFSWGESIPVISSPESYGGILYLGPFFNLLPILAITLMIAQQQMLMPPPTDEQQVAQRKMMKYMMIFFGILFYKVAAGLCVYFIASSVWGFMERKLLPKKEDLAKGKPVKATDSVVSTSKDTNITTDKKSQWKGTKKDRGQRKGQKGKKGGKATTSQTVSQQEQAPIQQGGWFSRMRKRLSDWWQDVLEKAREKNK